MQLVLPGVAESSSPQGRSPSLRVRRVGKDQLAMRYKQVGEPQRFQVMLQRLRLEFPLAVCKTLEGQPWWIVATTQLDQVKEFCKRNGLQLIEEQ
jgi:hypothetical protein